MSWLSDFVDQHKELESPKSFWFWAGISAISATVKDSVWLNRQIYNLYPNIYVMFHAESGLKKGPPVNAAKKLVKLVNNTRIISGRGSIQGILKHLGTAQTEPGGKVNTKSVAFICSSELSSSIVEDKVATKILTDLYDRNYNEGEWASMLKLESFTLKDPTITMLTATNEAMSEDFFTRSAIQGGYFARTFIIYEKENIVNNSLIFPLEKTPDYTVFANYLKELARLNGPFAALASLEESDAHKYRREKFGRTIWFNETGMIYDDWYEAFRNMVRDMETKDETGTLNRFGDSVLKVAMLLSLAESPNLIISPACMTGAISECEKLLGNVRKATLGKHGMSSSALLKSAIIMELLSRETHQISRQMLMKKMWMHFSTTEEFDDMMRSLDTSGMIHTASVGNNILFDMPETQVKQMQRFMSGKGELK